MNMQSIWKYAASLVLSLLLFFPSVNADDHISLTRIFQGDIVNDGSISAGVCFGDYDNDGFLDLFVANWRDQNNLLYHNNGDGTYARITEGAIVNDSGFSSGPCWGDYDGDGFLDLFVANQKNQNNCLYRNNGDD